MKKNKVKEKSKIKKREYPDEFYFDDCLICRGIKSAYENGKELSSLQLKKLFKKANKDKR